MLVMRAEPNPAHRAIAKMAELIPQFVVITQNVDDLHERAGSPKVIHLHGRLRGPFCEGCRSLHKLPDAIPDLPTGGVRIDPPRCTACGARIRPGVVWFGEELPREAWQLAASRADVMLTIGTSSLVQPAASLTHIAARAGATTVQINPSATTLDPTASFSLAGPAGVILPELLIDVWGPDASGRGSRPSPRCRT